MENLNAEQIIKALECCTSEKHECANCSYCRDEYFCDREQFKKDALALINSQEQRIKELTEENERLQTYLDEHFPKCIYQYDGDVQEYCVLGPCGQFKTVADFQKQIEADTVRKMQESLKAHLEKPEFPWDSFTVAEEVIDQIAKEMLEDKPCT